ncbi:MAG: hypothetical protein ABI210_06135 [Abditibacteriaceae bacterium]
MYCFPGGRFLEIDAYEFYDPKVESTFLYYGACSAPDATFKSRAAKISATGEMNKNYV